MAITFDKISGKGIILTINGKARLIKTSAHIIPLDDDKIVITDVISGDRSFKEKVVINVADVTMPVNSGQADLINKLSQYFFNFDSVTVDFDSVNERLEDIILQLQGIYTDVSTELTLKEISDNLPSKDAFGMTNTASPETIFDAQFTYSLQPLVYEVVAPTGSTITHDATNKAALVGVDSASGLSTFIQTYEYFRYQPGKAQRIYITFNFRGASANATKFVQYGDGLNALRVELRPNGTAWARIITATGEGNKEVQITHAAVDWNKEQILVIEFEALYVGSVNFSLQFGQKIEKVAVFNNANNSLLPYIGTANLPIRVGIDTTGAAETTMLFNCVSVQASGGHEETVGYSHVAKAAYTSADNVNTHGLSVRPKLTYNGFQNRVKFIFFEIEVIVTGNNSLEWELCLGHSITGASYQDVNALHSAMEVTTAGTLSGSAQIIVDSGYVGASNQVKGGQVKRISSRYPITLDANGNHRPLGTFTFCSKGIGGSTANRVTLKWVEIR